MQPIHEYYTQVKTKYPSYLVLIRHEDFYETFNDDAQILVRLFDRVLTAHDGIISDNPDLNIMASFPVSRWDDYAPTLIRRGMQLVVVKPPDEVIQAYELSVFGGEQKDLFQ